MQGCTSDAHVSCKLRARILLLPTSHLCLPLVGLPTLPMARVTTELHDWTLSLPALASHARHLHTECAPLNMTIGAWTAQSRLPAGVVHAEGA